MSVGIVYHFEPEDNWGHFRNLSQALDIKKEYQIGINSISIQEIKDKNKDMEHIFIDKSGKNIKDFKHPKNALYYVGHDKNGFGDYSFQQEDKIVSIPTTINLHSVTALAMVLQDRNNGNN